MAVQQILRDNWSGGMQDLGPETGLVEILTPLLICVLFSKLVNLSDSDFFNL